MAQFGDEDLDTFLDEMGVVVVWPDAQITGKGIKDEGSDLHSFSNQKSEVLVIEASVLVLTQKFPGLRKNHQLLVDGEPVWVNRAEPEADGRFSRVYFRS